MSNSQANRMSIVSDGITFEADHRCDFFRATKIVFWNLVFIIFFVFATLKYIQRSKSCETNCGYKFCSPYILLVLMTVVIYSGVVYSQVLKKRFGKCFSSNVIDPAKDVIGKVFKTGFSRFLLSMVVLALLIMLIVFETRDDFHRLRSTVGIVSFIAFGYVFSYNKYAIRWRPVLCGFSLQLLLGIFCIRWDVGRVFFQCFTDKIIDFLHYAQQGAAFVFGDFLVYDQLTFAFATLPTVFYFSLVISILFYLGAMQWILMNLGWILQSILGTTVCESVVAAGNIFLGQTESPLMIRPYVQLLTHSEIHAVIVSGFATVSGTTLVAYIAYGAEAYHLIAASVMAAPASLFYSKLFYPETEESLTSSDNIRLENSTNTSLLDAASNGAKNGIEVFLNVLANLIAFVAFLAFADGMLKYLTLMVGYEDVGIEFILGKLFIPVSWSLGVEWEDCEAVGHVIGSKTFINEFVAYKMLGDYKKAGEISLRSAAIATYAVCGFGNPSAMGIMIGALSAIAPKRRPSVAKVTFRAFIAGCIVPLITASIAGLLMTDEMIANSHNSAVFDNKTSILF